VAAGKEVADVGARRRRALGERRQSCSRDRRFKDLDRQIKVTSRNTVDLKIVLAVGIIGLTIIEVGATAATPVWVTIAVFGLNHLVQMHPGGAGDRPAARATARA